MSQVDLATGEAARAGKGGADAEMRITRAYVAVFSGLAIFALAGYLVLQSLAAVQQSAMAASHASARQRMLSQRTAMLAQQVIAATGPAQVERARADLIKARDLMLGSHTGLVSRGTSMRLPSTMSDAVRQLYFGDTWSIDAKMRRYIGLVDDIAARIEADRPAAERAFAELWKMAQAELLVALDLVGAQYEREAVAALVMVRTGLAATLVALIAAALFVFRPLARKIALQTGNILDAKAEVEHASLHDMLTGLPNRRQCAEELERAIASARRNDRRVAVLHIDLDRFKQINDTLGHAVGDSVLVSAARRFERSVRRGDTIARVGGDEFVIIAPIAAEPTEAARIATRIIKKMSRPIQCGPHTVTTAASIGISIFPDDETDPEQLLINADIALYRAKDAGRGRVYFFSPEMRRDYENRERLEEDLRRAIAEDEFEVYFQPQVSGDDNRVVGMEALVRWRHPDKGLLSADKFMQAADSSGLIVPIGKRVIDRAIAAASGWRRRRLDFGVVSINVSAAQFKDERFVDFLQERMDSHGLEPRFVSIEVMESVLTDHRNEAIGKMIGRLQDLGVTVELDDFGTGYAALSHLKRYKINRLKIDRTFIGAIGKEGQNANLIKTLVDVARNFDIQVLAEGVETEAQRSFLSALGCIQVQGYQVARPMSCDAAECWLSGQTVEKSNVEPLRIA